MSTRTCKLSAVCLVFSLTTWATAITAFAVPIEGKTSYGVSYMSGGVGEDEREELRALGQSSSLKLIFAQKEGDYLSDVAVSIRDQGGRAVLDTIANGPWLFANLPSGQYVVTATSKGVTHQQEVRVSAQHQKQLAFYW
jgi:hypothetical protein